MKEPTKGGRQTGVRIKAFSDQQKFATCRPCIKWNFGVFQTEEKLSQMNRHRCSNKKKVDRKSKVCVQYWLQN